MNKDQCKVLLIQNREEYLQEYIYILKYSQFVSEICSFESEIVTFTEMKCIYLISETLREVILQASKRSNIEQSKIIQSKNAP